MNRHLKILLALPRTLWFCFRYLPLRQALRLPVWLAPNVRVKHMWRGGIRLGKCSVGIVRIGFHEADAVDVYSAHTILDIYPDGVVEFEADVHIGQGAIVCVKQNAKLATGRNFAISGTTSIVCSKSISIGHDVQFSWDTLVMDSDAHHILGADHTPMQNTAPVSIGNHVWIAAGCTLLKGTGIGNECVVAGNSLLNKKYDSDNVLIAGAPARIIKTIGGWKL